MPKISVIVRKAYGAGLYAMCGPAFEPDACIALPTASIAVMGPQAAVNAVYYNRIQEIPEGPEREAFVAKLRDEYRAEHRHATARERDGHRRGGPRQSPARRDPRPLRTLRAPAPAPAEEAHRSASLNDTS